MATANDLMRRALTKLVVAGNEAEIEAVEAQDFITVLNGVVDEYESDPQVFLTGDGAYNATTNVITGTDFTAITNVADTLTSADGLFLALADVVAYRLAQDYGIPVSQELARDMMRGHDKILRLCTVRKGSFYPSRLPYGSGNEDDGSNYGSGHLYSGTEN